MATSRMKLAGYVARIIEAHKNFWSKELEDRNHLAHSGEDGSMKKSHGIEPDRGSDTVIPKQAFMLQTYTNIT